MKQTPRTSRHIARIPHLPPAGEYEVHLEQNHHKRSFLSQKCSPEDLNDDETSSKLDHRGILYRDCRSKKFDAQEPLVVLSLSSQGSRSPDGKKMTQSAMVTQPNSPSQLKWGSQRSQQVSQIRDDSDHSVVVDEDSKPTQSVNLSRRNSQTTQRDLMSDRTTNTRAICLSRDTCSRATPTLLRVLVAVLNSQSHMHGSAKSLAVSSRKHSFSEQALTQVAWLALNESKILRAIMLQLKLSLDTKSLVWSLLFRARNRMTLAADVRRFLAKNEAFVTGHKQEKFPGSHNLSVASAYSCQTAAVMYLAIHVEEYTPRALLDFADVYAYNPQRVNSMKNILAGLLGMRQGQSFRVAPVFSALKLIVLCFPRLDRATQDKLHKTALLLSGYDFWLLRQAPMSAAFGIVAFFYGTENAVLCSVLKHVQQQEGHSVADSPTKVLSIYASEVKKALEDIEGLYRKDAIYFSEECTELDTILTRHTAAYGYTHGGSSASTSQESSCRVSN